MDDDELNSAFRVHLGSSGEGGYQPIGVEERLVSTYGEKAPAVRAVVVSILAEVCDVTPDQLKTGDLEELGSLVEARAAKAHPELADDVCRSIGNYYTYQWR